VSSKLDAHSKSVHNTHVTELAKVSSELTRVKKELMARETELKEARDRASRLAADRAKSADEETDRAEAIGKVVKRHEKTIAGLERKCATAETAHAKAEARVAHLVREVETLKTTAAEKEAALDKAGREHSRVSERLAGAEAEVRRLSAELSSVDMSSWHHLTKLGADAGRLLKENVDLKVAMEMSAEEQKTLQTKCDALTEEVRARARSCVPCAAVSY
jgi:chromosome segregation ATPase